MRKLAILGAVVILAGLAVYLLRRPAPPPAEKAFVGERKTTLWSRLAQVREPITTLSYGEAVSVFERRTDPFSKTLQARVRSKSGLDGWVDARHLLAPAIFERATKLLEHSRTIPVQARGRTKVLTNVRLEAGRTGTRFFQLRSGQPVEILAREVAVPPAPAEEPAAKESASAPSAHPAPMRKEDWLLVRAKDDDAAEVAGWVRGSFIELDLPEPLRAYAAGIRFIAWFVLNRVPAGEESSSQTDSGAPTFREQYLGFGTTEPEGGACDFTLLRFYTWDRRFRRYATAYVESRLCGHLPVRVTPIPADANPERATATFSFAATGKSGAHMRYYEMRQNILRPVRAPR